MNVGALCIIATLSLVVLNRINILFVVEKTARATARAVSAKTQSYGIIVGETAAVAVMVGVLVAVGVLDGVAVLVGVRVLVMVFVLVLDAVGVSATPSRLRMGKLSPIVSDDNP